MPTTVNGIGTHYYGKKNVNVRQGLCAACNRVGPLTSYDTRLWFVFVFIPVIPLGRKRIIDQCSACGRHWVVQADQFQMAKQLNVSGALDKYRSAHSTEAAIEAHAQLCAFHQFEEATSFRQSVLNDFPNDAELFVSLALQLDHFGQSDEAAKLLDVGFRLRPDLPMARVAKARRLMRERKLDEARALLDFLEQPGASQLHSLEPLDELAGAYQQAGRHEEALTLCRRLLDEYPAVGQHYQFRNFVTRSEKALRRTESILPKTEFSWRKLFDPKSNAVTPGKRWAVIGAVIVVVVVAVLGLNNEYTRRHRRLNLVNAFNEPATIQFDGTTTLTVQGKQEVVLAEGLHRATVSGPVDDQVEFEVRTGYFDRWFSRPVWLFNIGGKETFAFTQIYYAVNPTPSNSEFIIGEQFRYFKNVDYPFETPPSSLQVEGSKTVVKTHLSTAPATDGQLMLYLEQNRGADEALSFAESRLQHKLVAEKFVESYSMAASRTDKSDRAKQFLDAGRKRRPVSISWHRAYQNLCQGPDRARLVQEYDDFVKAEPKNGALLYLRGRVAETSTESKEFFQRAMEAEPTLPWPWYALAYDACSSGKWDECVTKLQKAKELGLDDDVFDEILHVSRMGRGDAEQLVAEYRQSMPTQSSAKAGKTMIRLCDALISLSKADEAREDFGKWLASLETLPEKAALEETVQLAFEYMAGDLDKLTQSTAQPNQALDYLQLQALLGLRKGDDILANERFGPLLKEPWNALSLALVLELGGNAQQAQAWNDKARTSFENKTGQEARIALLLQGKQEPTNEALEAIAVSPQQKAVLLAVLASRSPMHRSELLAQAKRMNVVRTPPYHLVRSVTENP